MEDRSDLDQAGRLEEEVEAGEGEDQHRFQDTMFAFPSRNGRRESKCDNALCEANKVGIITIMALTAAIVVESIDGWCK